MRRFPASDLNIFQQVYSLIEDSGEKFGEPALNLALGNPDGVPPKALRELQARFAADPARR